MCGRLVLTSSFKERIRAIFSNVAADEWHVSRYNITPGQRVPAITQEDSAQLSWVHWGYTPASTPTYGARKSLLINSRAETIDRLPSFKYAFNHCRCLVLADGFYEWKRSGLAKPQPYYFRLKHDRVMMLAGLLLKHPVSSPEKEGEGCVIITTEANSLMHPIHHRIPVILNPDVALSWLNAETCGETLKSFLQPYPSSEMKFHAVSDRVNKSASEGSALIEPVKIIEQTELF